jgi:ABC-type uncharacterized transport system auxiliary subunit
MKRRALLLVPLLLAGCNVLPARPYRQKRDWPLVVRRPVALPPRAGGGVLLLRNLAAAPGLEERGLHTLQPDGSMRVSYDEEWLTAPAFAIEDSLRRWLAESGLFAAVLAPGSRVDADLVLEAELTALWADAGAKRAVADIGYALLDQRHGTASVRDQQTVAGAAPLTGADAAASVAAQLRALADAFAGIERNLAAFA